MDILNYKKLKSQIFYLLVLQLRNFLDRCELLLVLLVIRHIIRAVQFLVVVVLLLDFLAVVETPLEHDEKVALIQSLLARTPDAPPKGIEMSVVTLDACRNFVHPTPYELHFSNAHLERYLADIDGYCEQLCGCDPDLAAHFTVVNACGIALYGRPAAEVFSPVPREAMVASILSDVADARDGFDENPVYFTLNLCRTLAYLEENLVLSKKGGGEWALAHLPETHHRAIRSALKAYTTNEPAALSGMEAFRDYALEQLLR